MAASSGLGEGSRGNSSGREGAYTERPQGEREGRWVRGAYSNNTLS